MAGWWRELRNYWRARPVPDDGCYCGACSEARIVAKLNLVLTVIYQGHAAVDKIACAITNIQNAIGAFRKEVLDKMSEQGDAIQQELTTLEQKVAAAKASSDKIVADVEALIAKVNAGGGVTADELSAIIGHAQAIGGVVDTIATQETAADATANPPTPGQ